MLYMTKKKQAEFSFLEKNDGRQLLIKNENHQKCSKRFNGYPIDSFPSFFNKKTSVGAAGYQSKANTVT
ncbi:hypothetical protein BTA30_15665 [Bacillus swezeyi]|uniref:Uncharacterized protein n=1 Tax=Bacillus swezeyi TaxID=1925020 RepID=A0A1R1RQ34_9BACI|nr:hypothetical protein BW143_16035 [Bacillus swezeyi]OMI28156.1 hypothetical protein BTA30_15665 [Bacillus swezeyi]